MVPLIVMIVGLGVYPKPVLDRITLSAERLLEHVQERVGIIEPGPTADRSKRASLDTPIPFNSNLENNFMAQTRLANAIKKLQEY